MNADYWKRWGKAAAIRAVRTFAQSVGSMITVGAAINELNWGYIASVAAVSALYSILTAISGLPEVGVMENADRR